MYIYHQVPSNLTGHLLYPLSQLRLVDSFAWEQANRKYEGRDYLKQRYLPKLNCYWNDVVHCAPVNPQKVYQEVTEAGYIIRHDVQWFCIPIKAVAAPIAIFYSRDNLTNELSPDDIELLSPREYVELKEVPEGTKQWYKQLKREGKALRGLFHRCPHVFVKGVIDVSEATIITWEC